MSLLNVPKNVLIQTIIDLDVEDILSLCRTNKKLNQDVCENDTFWAKKLQKDFHIRYKSSSPRSAKSIYEQVSYDFDQAVNQILWEGYPRKMRMLLEKTGYLKEFREDVSKF